MQHRWLALAVLIASVLCGAATSQAAEVAVVDSKLVVTAAGQVNDIIDVRPTPFGYEVYDARDDLTAGTGCGNLTPRLAYCGFLVVAVKVDGAAGDDLIGLWDMGLPVEVSGGDGADFIEGGLAADSVDGGRGNDGIVGGQGNDLLTAGEDNDVVRGGDGADTIKGGDGDDVLEGEGGDGNVLFGGAGRDLLRGGPRDDRLNGDQGDDALIGGGGADVFETGPGADEMFGVESRDELRCTSRDRFRGELNAPTTCTTLAPSIPRPTIWPPQQTARAADLPPADPKVLATIRRPGAAKRTTVCIVYPYFVPDVLVRVRTYTRGQRIIKRFKRVMDAHTCRSFRDPGPGKKAAYARARRRGDSF